MQPSRPYPSDLSDARWELIRPTLEAWRQARNGIRKPTHDLRALINAILYVDRTGIPWRYLPHDFPPHQTVYGYFANWETDGIFDKLTGLLRGKVRQAENHSSEPTACLIDSQSIKTSATVHLADQGIDPAKKIIGRKRHIVTDTLGLLLAVAVTAASVHDSYAGTQLLTHVRARHPTITKAWADNGYKTKAIEQPPTSASTSKSSNAIPPPAASTSSPAAGSSNAPSAGSCTTAAWPATTKPTPTDQPP